jgi:hypothetical protein
VCVPSSRHVWDILNKSCTPSYCYILSMQFSIAVFASFDFHVATFVCQDPDLVNASL